MCRGGRHRHVPSTAVCSERLYWTKVEEEEEEVTEHAEVMETDRRAGKGRAGKYNNERVKEGVDERGE